MNESANNPILFDLFCRKHLIYKDLRMNRMKYDMLI
jgi:hypothetical protein